MDAQELFISADLVESTDRLGEVVEQEIVRRTWGQVHRLRVDFRHGCVVVSGCVATYHVKQLALAAVLDSLETTTARFVLDIDVTANGTPR